MLHSLRIQLAANNALLPLSLMAIPTSILASLIVLGFWWVIESLEPTFVELSALQRFLLPTAGGLLLGIWFYVTPSPYRVVGIGHVMERLAYHQGHLPFINAAQQFIGAVVSLSCGHSVGREGPSVHLGAASGSLLGQWLHLPNNSIRVLVACGTAAAIAASFNTPLAGVVFAMEVVMMEYSVISFTPVILSAAIGAFMTRWLYSDEPAFSVPSLDFVTTPHEVGYLLLVGIVIGCLAAVFNQLVLSFAKASQPYPIWQKFTLAGLVTGIAAIFVPQIMGIGYDSVNHVLSEQLSLNVLLSLVIVKLLVTTFGVGLGLPAGLIAPTLFIGAMTGGVMGFLAHGLFGDHASSPAFYAMLGMGAMMGATLQAPLAALTALMELTYNPNLIMPGMLVIVVSNLVAHAPPFRRECIFVELLRAKGLAYCNNSVAQSLRRTGVAAVMETDISIQAAHLSRAEIDTLLQQPPQWVLIQQHNQPHLLLKAADVVCFCQNHPQRDIINLLEIPAQRLQLAPIALQATLQEALDSLHQHAAEALYITAMDNKVAQARIYGVLTHQAIEEQYLFALRKPS